MKQSSFSLLGKRRDVMYLGDKCDNITSISLVRCAASGFKFSSESSTGPLSSVPRYYVQKICKITLYPPRDLLNSNHSSTSAKTEDKIPQNLLRAAS